MQWVVSDMGARARHWYVLLAVGALASASGCRAAEKAPAAHEAQAPAAPAARGPMPTFRVEPARLESTPSWSRIGPSTSMRRSTAT